MYTVVLEYDILVCFIILFIHSVFQIRRKNLFDNKIIKRLFIVGIRNNVF